MSLSRAKTRGPSQSSEATLFYSAQSGNREALNQLMARHDRLVQAVIQRCGSGRLAYADALQAGRIGLWRAILWYDPQRGTAFSTYAWTCIMRRIGQTVKRETPPARRQRVGAPWFCAEATDPVQLTEQHILDQAVHELVHRLPWRQCFAIRARDGLDGDAPASFVQIGCTLGLSAERARQLHCEALLWLRQPAHSQMLRSLLDRHTATDYPALEALQQRWWYPRRGHHER